MNIDIGYDYLLPALQFFAEMTHSYGWAIILVTLAVRIVVWPLVVMSTQSMQKMAKLQPQLNAMKARYKADPEMFQKKSMEFFAKNKVNPMSGCWPILVQMPILIALYAAFSGPPFGDRVIDVKVNVADQQQATKVQQAQTSSGNSPYVTANGKQMKVVIFPGDSTINTGDSIDFGLRVIEGEPAWMSFIRKQESEAQLPKDFSATWKIVAPGNKPQDAGTTTEAASMDVNGHATFFKPGEYHVQALIPGIAKGEPFWLIGGLGKVAHGGELLKPSNWDCLVLILLFGATMYLSQKLTVATPKPAPGEQLDEQQIIQQQTMKTMPIVTTGMFMFIPLPAGVLLYLVISNVFQTLQTMLIMKMPTPALISVIDDDGSSPPPTNSNGSAAATSARSVSTVSGARTSRSKRKAKRKKNEK